MCSLVLTEIYHAKESHEEFVKTQASWSPQPGEIQIGRFGVCLRVYILERPQMMLLRVDPILDRIVIISS